MTTFQESDGEDFNLNEGSNAGDHLRQSNNLQIGDNQLLGQDMFQSVLQRNQQFDIGSPQSAGEQQFPLENNEYYDEDYLPIPANRNRQSASKTGGMIELNLKEGEITKGKYNGINSANRLEAEIRQFDEYKGQKRTQHFAERKATGEFKKTDKNLDLSAPANFDDDGEVITAADTLDDFQSEKELIKNQIYWTQFVKSFFSCTLGLLAGSSVLHSCVIVNLALFVDETMFLELYPQFSIQINIIFLILGNLVVIQSITLALIHHKTQKEKEKILDKDRYEYRTQFTRATVLSVILSIAFVALLWLPQYTSKVFYKGTEWDKTGPNQSFTILMVNVLYLLASFLYIVAFTIQACQQQAPDDEEINIDSDDDGIDTSSDEDDYEHMGTAEM